MTVPGALDGGWRVRFVERAIRHVPPLRFVWLYRRFLKETGWRASAWAHAPVDAQRRPVPWYTYAAQSFLEPRVGPEMEIFEFGAGNSTLWWAARVGFVCSVESDADWSERIQSRLPPNAELHLEPAEADGAYCRSALPGDGFSMRSSSMAMTATTALATACRP